MPAGSLLPIQDDQIRVPEDGTPSPSSVRLVVDRQDHTLRGTVVNVDGLPVADTRVSLFPELRHTDAVSHTYTGSDGAFMLRDLGVGPFRLTAAAPSGSETELGPLSLPHTPLRIVLGEVGTLRGTLEGFRTTPTVMAWTRRGYDWESLHYATVEGSRFSFGGFAPDHYYVAASSNDQATTVEVSVIADSPTDVTLVASATRTVRGKLVDLITGRGLAGSQCQAAPYSEGTRSPVVVPGAVRTDESGVFEFRDVPASDLYAWCLATETARGGVGRIPAHLPRGEFTVYGLDVTGRPAVDAPGLGFDFDDDRPFSHAVFTIEPGGPAARSGLATGDIVVQVGPTDVAEVGNGTVRNYLALLLTEESHVPLVVVRGETLTELSFRLAH